MAARPKWKEKYTNLEAKLERTIIPLLKEANKLLKSGKEIQGNASQTATELREKLRNATQTVTIIQEHQKYAKASADGTQINQRKATQIVTEIERQVGQINETIGGQTKRQEKQNEEYKNLMEKILTFYGGKKQGDGTRSGGIRSKIEEALKQLEEIEEKRTESALSESFKTQAETHKKRAEQIQRTYWWILGALVGVVAIPVGLISFFSSPAWILVPSAAVTGSLIYVLWHQTRKNSEENRLYAEYAHKSALAKTYRAYNREASKDEKLELMLLRELLNAIKKKIPMKI